MNHAIEIKIQGFMPCKDSKTLCKLRIVENVLKQKQIHRTELHYKPKSDQKVLPEQQKH